VTSPPVARVVRRLAPIALLAAVWGVFVAYSWPGFMSYDSMRQLVQARSGELGNWHPPLMAWVWSMLDSIVAGPALMLILQTGLFMIGLFAVLRRYAAPMRAAVVSAAVFLFPPVFAPMSVIWKDSLMAAVLLCAVAGLSSRARLARILGWLGLIAVAALRHNAPLLIVPIAAMLVPLPEGGSTWRRRALGAGLGVAVSIAGLLVSRGLTRVDEHPFANMIAMPDVAAVIATSEAMTDAEVGTLLGDVQLAVTRDVQARLRALQADDTDWQPLSVGEQHVFELITTDAQAAAMSSAWRRAIAEHPGRYLAHRLVLLGKVLGWTHRRPIPYVTPLSESRDVIAVAGEVRSYSAFQRAVGRLLLRISRSIVFWPTLYFVLGIGLLVILWRDPLQRGLLIGALGYELALFFASPGGQEHRYSHWMITCAVIAAAVRLLGAARGPAADPAGERMDRSR
jgi:hypothetical protein